MAVATVELDGAGRRRARRTTLLAIALALASAAPALAGGQQPAAPAMQAGSWRETGPSAGPAPSDQTQAPVLRAADCVGVDLVKSLQTSDAAGFARFENSARAVANGQGLLWRVEGRGSKPSYLFGTMHSSEAIAKSFDELVLAALRRSRIVATELPGASTRRVAAELRRLVANRSFRPGGDSLGALSPDLRAQVEERIARAGIPAPVAEQLQPWYLALALSRSRCGPPPAGVDTETADARIERLAVEQGARLTGLETPAEQVEALASIPDEVALRMMREATEKGLKPEDVESTIMGLYSTRRIGYLLAMRGPDWAGAFDVDGYAEFISSFITRRNASMLQRALPLLGSGEAFIAVGALHLPGDRGLVQLIRQAGFSVTRIW
ncbi:TraB/GumN family protein [Chenggangzhangella methanolivorans]|uniref:TraB/GumN family protein n=1 Tax=Chenggangzhangella methanolivorans TaxID=1437009 RepID=A0A9E6UR71_9HYPH|nr:TraB/GumN family protein [Chenggangzhangella methanolivorans]QZO01940.1 TraB/GumN family protein [Chenggangzhangella methanolivorans]